MIDGDAEYDVSDLFRLLKASKDCDLVITYRYKKKYSTNRIIISWIYNAILRLMFRIKFRDISTGSRFVSRRLAENVKLESNSPFVGAELAIKAGLAGYKVGEIGKVVLEGSAQTLSEDEDVREFYLGIGGHEQHKSYREIKHYKRRKRWLS